MPEVLARLAEDGQRDDVDMAGLALLIGQDPGITARLFEITRHGKPHDTHSPINLERVLTELGIDGFRTLLLTEAVGQVLSIDQDRMPPHRHQAWKRAVIAASAARLLAIRVGYADADESYIAGLLHEIGQYLVVNGADADDVTADSADARGDAHPSAAQAGAALIRSWNLTSFIADSVLYHAEPADRLRHAHPLIRIVATAHVLCAAQPSAKSIEEIEPLCGLGLAELNVIRLTAREQVRQTAEDVGIEHADDRPKAGGRAAARPSPKERLARQMGSMAIANAAAQFFSKQHEEHELLGAIIRTASIVFGFDQAAIFLVDGASGMLKGADYHPHHPRLREVTIPLDDQSTIADSVRRRRMTVIAEDDESLALHEEQLLRTLDAECLSCLPLFAGRQCIGVLLGFSGKFTALGLKSRQPMLEAFCAQIATAISNRASNGDSVHRQLADMAKHYQQMSRMVAHEVNNPLAIIKNYLSVLDRKLANHEPFNAEISILNEEIDRMSSIINGMAAGKPALQNGRTKLASVIHDVAQLFLQTGYRSPAARIEVDMDDAAAEVDCDPGTLKQVLVNLVKNAMEAMPDGGRIDIRHNGYVNREGTLYAELSVRDTGPGMSAEQMAHLFSPVRSTKGESHQGLGLSIVHSLLSKANSLISCRSNSEGTNFEILLPATRRGPVAASVVAPAKKTA